MKFIIYIFAYSLLWLTARLPQRIIYLISDFFYLIVYYVIGYRKKVVYKNLSLAFPEYSKKQVRRTAKKFYRHFSDVILESAITPFTSDGRINKRLCYKNPELIERLYKEGKILIGIGAHYGNWEVLMHLEVKFPYPFVAIYKPLNNKYFDRLLRRSRARYGSILVAMNRVARVLMEFKNNNTIAFCGFLADQRPIWEHIQYWTKFMGQDTPVYLGPEKIARKLEAAVVYMMVRKLKRGFYEVSFDLITENAKTEEPYMITETQIRLLEKLIREEPAYWLWSHNRWRFNYNDFIQKHPNYKKSGGID